MTGAKRVTTGIAALLAAGAVAAGCGNGEANDYVDEVNGLHEELIKKVDDAVAAVPPGDPKAFAEVSVELQGAFSETADELEAVDPPDEVAPEHDELVESIRGVGAQWGEAEAGLASGNAQKARQAAVQMQTASNELGTKLQATIDEINSKLGD